MRDSLVTAVLFSGALAYYLSYAWSFPFNFGDEGYLYAVAGGVAHGLQLYRDIELNSYMPGLFFLFSLFSGTPGETLNASRATMAVMLAFNVCLLYLITRAAGSRVMAIAVALVLCLVPGPWYKAYQPTLWLALLGCAQQYFMTRRTAWLAALGACTALGLYFRIEVSIAGFVMLALVLWLTRALHVDTSSSFTADTGVAFTGFVLTLLPLLTLLDADRILADYVTQLIELPRHVGERIAGPYRLEAPGLWRLGHLSHGRTHAWLYWGAILVPGLLVANTIWLAREARTDHALRNELGLSLLALVWLAMNLPQYAWERPDPAHLAERLFALLAATPIIVAPFIRQFGSSTSQPRRALSVVLASVLISYFVAYLMIRHSGDISGGYHRASFHPVLANGMKLPLSQPMQPLLERIIADTSPNDPIVALPYGPGFNVVTDRPFPSRQIYLFPFNTNPLVEANFICALELKHVRYVLYNENFSLDRTERTRMSNYAPRLHAYLKSHFAIDQGVDNWLLLRRTNTAQREEQSAGCALKWPDELSPGPSR
ncbi:hypothetical protein [Ferribacterium limneticum]|uniref:hypothetical protein n=1 Tax=Ferribacterium limneticum TaxID=76259 RepID=UPI001CFAEBD4|nr:hypothetical protein [Ferribacterium limneticum]UCV20286.1 hypothetical protein KI610_06870 [Ferribacterium limneticum]